MSKRIYLVESTDAQEAKRLVKATSPSQAVRHVASKYSAEVASQDQLVQLLSVGVKVEDAGVEAE